MTAAEQRDGQGERDAARRGERDGDGRGGHPLRVAVRNGAWLAPSFLVAYLIADQLTTTATARTVGTLLLAPAIGLLLRLTVTGLRRLGR
ncbi:hypothetical protein [Kitasatospora sp. NPDC004289]